MTSLLERFAPARLGRGYRWLLSSYWVGSVGDGIALAAGPLLVASQTRSAFLVAAAALLQRLPWLVLGLYAGVIADRVDRRALIVTSETFRAVVITLLTISIFTGYVNVELVLAAMLLLGISDVFSNTTTGTLLPMLVDTQDLGLGNSRLQASFVVGRQLLGPAVGAFLFTAGHAWPFLTQTILVILAMLLVARIGSARVRARDADPGVPAPATASPGDPAPADAGPSRDGRGVRQEIREGVRWLMGHPPVRTLALIILSFNITWGAAWSVLVLYALRHLHMGKVGFGLLSTASAAGGILAILIYRRLEQRWPPSLLMRVCLTLEVFMHLSLALDDNGAIALGIMFVFGAYSFVWATVSQTVRQRSVPHELQGRVGSVYLMCVFGGIVAGQLIGGLIAERWGVVAPFWFAFGGSGLTLMAVWRQLDEIAHAGT